MGIKWSIGASFVFEGSIRKGIKLGAVFFLGEGIRFIKRNSGFYWFKQRSIKNARGLALLNQLNLIIIFIVIFFIFPIFFYELHQLTKQY